MYFKLKVSLIIALTLITVIKSIELPNRKTWSVSTGQVTEVRLDLPHLITGSAWTYHIKLSSKDEFVPTMWLGYPIYLPEHINVSSGENCLIPQDVRAFSTHHILKVTYKSNGFTVQMTNFLGNETSEEILANYPEILLFSTQGACYQGEMLVYQTTVEYMEPKLLPALTPSMDDHPMGHDHSGMGHDHSGMGHDHSGMGHDHSRMGDDTRPIHADFYRDTGHGTWGPATPMEEGYGTSWIAVIVIVAMVGVGIVYYIGKKICKGSSHDAVPTEEC